MKEKNVLHMHERIAIYPEYHKLAEECLSSDDLTLRELGTKLIEMLITLEHDDNDKQMMRIYQIAHEIKQHIAQFGLRQLFKEQSNIKETKDDEPDLSKFNYYIFRTEKGLEGLNPAVMKIFSESEIIFIYSDPTYDPGKKMVSLYKTPGGQYLVFENFTHNVDYLAGETIQYGGLMRAHGYALYGVSKEDAEKLIKLNEEKKPIPFKIIGRQ